MPHSGASNPAWHSPPPPSKGGFQMPYTINVHVGGGTVADTGGGKEGQHMCLGEWNSWERAPDSAETIYL